MNGPASRHEPTEPRDALSLLAGGLAHDLNNLFAVITSAARFVERELGDGQIADDVRDILEATDRGAEIVDRLRGVAARQALRPQPLCLSKELAEMADDLRAAAGDSLEIEIEEGTGLALMDRVRMRWSLLSLVGAAARLKDGDGRVAVRVRESLEADERETIMEIESRPAKSELPLERLFEPYCVNVTGYRGGLDLAAARGNLAQSGAAVSARVAEDALVISVRIPHFAD